MTFRSGIFALRVTQKRQSNEHRKRQSTHIQLPEEPACDWASFRAGPVIRSVKSWSEHNVSSFCSWVLVSWSIKLLSTSYTGSGGKYSIAQKNSAGATKRWQLPTEGRKDQ